jgi:manganese/zinc/iron transport system permease protein
MSPQAEVQLVAAVTAVACALPGAFLVLRRLSMMSDAISHAILPGIVVGFMLTESLASPLLIAGAAATGVLTVVLVERIEGTGLVREDAAIGLVFPVLFSIGVVLLARYASDVHLDVDAVLLGELAFVPFDRLEWGGRDLGPRALWVMGTVLLLNAAFLTAFYKELKLSTFDAQLAATLGFMPGVLHYALMSLVSVTAVSAFDAVGSILVVALMVAPPATAYLLTDRLDRMIVLSAGLGVGHALVGYAGAAALDASIAGSMATVAGLFFGMALVAAPERGLLATWRRQRQHTARFSAKLLVAHLAHPSTPPVPLADAPSRLHDRFGWTPKHTRSVISDMRARGVLTVHNGRLACTEAGQQLADEAAQHAA